MPSRPRDPAALLRGGVAGALTAALATAAHATAGGAVPAAAAPLLAVLSAGVGAVAATAGRLTDPRLLAVLLACGQLAGHLLLSAAGHSHSGSPPMLLAHLTALLAGAGLIGVAERLCRLLCGVLRRAAATAPGFGPGGGHSTLPRPDQPLRSRLLVAVSISHRGPPVAAA